MTRSDRVGGVKNLYRKRTKGLIKHWDFILLDILCMQAAFVASFWLFHGFHNPYRIQAFQYQAIVLFLSQLLITAFAKNYGGILRRKRFDELLAIFQYILGTVLLAILFMFLTHNSAIASRLQIGFTAVFFLLFDFIARHLNKLRVIRSSEGEKGKRSLVLFTSAKLVDEALEKLYITDSYRDFTVSQIVLLDGEAGEMPGRPAIPISTLSDRTLREIGHDWVDEAFILQSNDMVFPSSLMDDLMTMGITVSYTMAAVNNDKWPNTDVKKLGEYKVLTNAVRIAAGWELAAKRLMDIVGGVVGCILTGVIFLFVAPLIYAADPGPVIFTQERIGENGKRIRIHKFRSMYLDAEKRKAELMSENKVKDGMMFKLDDDPRIIGSEKKDRNGRPRGIGNFIRSTSLDEFPQFFDCLIGNMSLVGWRPCTLEEWEKYDLKHRIRASMKPGISGPWQVSGRSEITDFDEVVKLDREYIEKWNLLLDIKILLKTVVVVLKCRGAE